MTKSEIAAPANLPALAPEQGEFLLYTAEEGKNVIRVRFHDESLWLSQKQMAERFRYVYPRSTPTCATSSQTENSRRNQLLGIT